MFESEKPFGAKLSTFWRGVSRICGINVGMNVSESDAYDLKGL
jgi:hypothetical protein